MSSSFKIRFRSFASRVQQPTAAKPGVSQFEAPRASSRLAAFFCKLCGHPKQPSSPLALVLPVPGLPPMALPKIQATATHYKVTDCTPLLPADWKPSPASFSPTTSSISPSSRSWSGSDFGFEDSDDEALEIASVVPVAVAPKVAPEISVPRIVTPSNLDRHVETTTFIPEHLRRPWKAPKLDDEIAKQRHDQFEELRAVLNKLPGIKPMPRSTKGYVTGRCKVLRQFLEQNHKKLTPDQQKAIRAMHIEMTTGWDIGEDYKIGSSMFKKGDDAIVIALNKSLERVLGR
jgi:hypothetical protein